MSERDDLLPQLPPPNLVGHRTSDGYDTYRDADFTPDLTWSYPFAEQRGYVHVARFVNEFRVERAEGRDVEYVERTVHHGDRRVVELGGGRCRTEVRVSYERRLRRGWLLFMKYEHWTTDVLLESYLETAGGKGATAVATAGDAAAVGAGLSAGAAGVATPPGLLVATGVSTFVATTGFMQWVKADDIHELYETGWKVLGWYTTRPELAEGAQPETVWEPVGEHPCDRPITGSPSPGATPAVFGGDFTPAGDVPASVPPESAPLPDGQADIEYDPTAPETVPFDLPHIDHDSLRSAGEGTLTDPTHEVGNRWIRLLERNGDAWIVVVFDNAFRRIRDELYDDEDVVFNRTGRTVDQPIGGGLCQLTELVTRHTVRGVGYRLDQFFRVLRISEHRLLETTGLTPDALVPMASAATSWADVAAQAAEGTRVGGTRFGEAVSHLSIGKITPFVGIGLNLISIFSEEDDAVELLATGWAPTGFVRDPSEIVPLSYREEWPAVGPPHPCDPELRIDYAPDWRPTGVDLPPVTVPQEPQVLPEPALVPGSVVIEPEVELDDSVIDRPTSVPMVDAATGTRSIHRLNADEITHVVVDGEPVPPEVLVAQHAAERHITLVTGIDVMGRSTLLSWTDPIGPRREAHGFRLSIPVTAAGRPVTGDEYPIHQRVGWIDIALFPEEPSDTPDGETPRRQFNLWVHVHDGANGRLVHSADATREDTPYTALRHVFEGFWATPWYLKFSVNRVRGLTAPETATVAVAPPAESPRVPGSPASATTPAPGGSKSKAPAMLLLLVILLAAAGVTFALVRSSDDSDANGGPADATADPTTPLTEPAADPSPAETEVPPDTELPADTEVTVETEPPPTDQPAEPEPVAIRWPSSYGVVGGPTDPPPGWAGMTPDPPGGDSFSVRGLAAQQQPATSLTESSATTASYDAATAEPVGGGTSYPCGAVTSEYTVTCPLGAGTFEAGEHLVIVVEHEGPVATGEGWFTYGLALDDDDDTDDYEAQPPFDADFFDGTEFWYQLQVDPDGTRWMWADGVREGVWGYPRSSSAMVIERDSSITWIVPRAELPEGAFRYRVTAFNSTTPPDQLPEPETSGGDISGATVDDPLIPIDATPVPFDNLAGLPPDTEGTSTRVDVGDDPDVHVKRVLVDEFVARANAAFAGNDPAAVDALLWPGQLDGPAADACREAVDGTIALADSMAITSIDAPPTVSPPAVFFTVVGTLTYPTGTVDWGPILSPGIGGRLALVIPDCLG